MYWANVDSNKIIPTITFIVNIMFLDMYEKIFLIIAGVWIISTVYQFLLLVLKSISFSFVDKLLYPDFEILSRILSISS